MFIRKSTHEKTLHPYRERIKRIEEMLASKERSVYELLGDIKRLSEENEDLSKKISELQANLDSKSDHTQAILYISDDLTTVTPVTKVKADMINKLVESGYLPWNKRDDELAVNLAVMTVAYEALEQIVFSFEEALREGDEVEEATDA